jgi:transcriptional regulator, LysR family
MLRTALADGGVTFAPEDCFLPWIANGALVPVLLDYVQPFPGFFLYYPSRHNPPPKLRALVAHVRAFNDQVQASRG